jgi:hypothetical protein
MIEEHHFKFFLFVQNVLGEIIHPKELLIWPCLCYVGNDGFSSSSFFFWRESWEATGGPTARLAWAGARARRLWTLKAKYTSTRGEGARGTGTSACYLDFVSCPGLSNFLGPPLWEAPTPICFIYKENMYIVQGRGSKV